MLLAVCAFYAVRGVDPEDILKANSLRQKFYAAAMLIELERSAETGGGL